MSDWKAKRFWTEVSVTEAEAGFGIALDGKPVRSPYKTLLRVPTRRLAEAIAVEWEAQDGAIDPETMPLTRMGNSALDKVAPQRKAVLAHLTEYAQTDLLCYRAERPQQLIDRQAEHWDPILAWAKDALSADLRVGAGLMPIDQPKEAIRNVASELERADNFELTGLHDLIGLSGSAILGLAVSNGKLSPQQAWDMSQLDERWQAEQWGDDDEALESAALKAASFLDAERFLRLSREQLA